MMLDRRSLLIVAATAVLPFRLHAQTSSEPLRLWPGTPPGGGGPSGPLATARTGAVSNVAMPTLRMVAPGRPNGAAMLVAAGGGYKRIESGKEADPAAQWLADNGVTAFILTYRLPGEGWREGPLAPLQDAQRAIRLIRGSAGRLGLDPHRLGVLGFSAGGHLLGLAAARSEFRSYAAVDADDEQSARPDVAALIYPVVTLEPPFDHTSTRRILVGSHPAPEASAAWSIETHVRAGCPPLFLAQAEDDPIADPQNTLILEAACRQVGVPVELHRFASGGHGFGMGRPETPTAAWPGLFRAWLTRQGMLR